MAIFDIFKAKWNSFMDNLEGEMPIEMLEQYMGNALNDQAKIKQDYASVLADKKEAEEALMNCCAEIDRKEELAKTAINNGSDEDASKLLKEKIDLESKKESLIQLFSVQIGNAEKMRSIYDEISSTVDELRERIRKADAISKIVKSQDVVSRESKCVKSSRSNIAKFEKIEKRLERKFKESECLAEITLNGNSSSTASLTAKYDALEKKARVQEELKRLKEEIANTTTPVTV